MLPFFCHLVKDFQSEKWKKGSGKATNTGMCKSGVDYRDGVKFSTESLPKEGLATKTEEKEAKPRYGIANLETRGYRSSPIRLPVEYYRVESPINQAGQTLEASEVGLQILFPEQMEIGQKLHLKLFFSSGSELNTIQILAEVIWINAQLAEGEKHFQSKVRFINIAPESTTKLKTFLASLS